MITKNEISINNGEKYIRRMKCYDTKGSKEYFKWYSERLKTALKGMYCLDTLDDIYYNGGDMSYMDEFNQLCDCFNGR